MYNDYSARYTFSLSNSDLIDFLTGGIELGGDRKTF